MGSFEYCHKRREDLCIRSVKNLLALQAQPEPVACSKTPNVNYGPSFFSYMERLLGLAPRKGRWRFFSSFSTAVENTLFRIKLLCFSPTFSSCLEKEPKKPSDNEWFVLLFYLLVHFLLLLLFWEIVSKRITTRVSKSFGK